VYGTQGAMPLGITKAARADLQIASGCEHGPNCRCGVLNARASSPRNHNADGANESSRVTGNPESGEWASKADDDEFDVAASGRVPCDGFSAGCQSGGNYGSSAMYRIDRQNLCTDCAVKFMGLEDEPRATQMQELDRYFIDR
jgi:hypothetical protein